MGKKKRSRLSPRKLPAANGSGNDGKGRKKGFCPANRKGARKRQKSPEHSQRHKEGAEEEHRAVARYLKSLERKMEARGGKVTESHEKIQKLVQEMA